MQSTGEDNRVFKVRGTEILATDTPRQFRQKLSRIALDEMYQFVAVLDVKGTLLEVNRAALEGAGLELSDVEGKPFWDCFWWAVSEETQETLRLAVIRASQGEFIRYDVEIYGAAHGTETIVIDFSMIPVKDESGHVVFIVPEGRDITEKKAYEVEIATKNKELQALLERIRRSDEIKAQFFANVSHELRTPLQLIIGPAERLMMNDATMSQDQRHDSAGVIVRNAQMLLKHVNDLLDISKFEAGQLKIELQDTDVTLLARLTASHFEVIAADRCITFQVEAQEDVVSAIDSEKIQRVIMNLLSNAFKFVPDAGVVRAKLRASEKDLTLYVEDSGPGIKPELRKVIFERFRQGEDGSNRQIGGTGLGLAIAKEFVAMHHGSLEISDSDLGGACFQMTIPRYRLSAAAPAAELQSTHAPDQVHFEGFIEDLRGSRSYGDEIRLTAGIANTNETVKPTVLVVEDNPEMNRFILETLSDEYNVLAAFDGGQGLKMALVANPALIVSDIMMPKVSGVQMIAELRKCPEMAAVPILLLSAKADEDLKVRLLSEGAQDFVAKPFSEKDLLVRVRNLIEFKESQECLRRRTAQFETLLNEAPLGMYLVDNNLFIREMNPSALAVFGDIPDLIGRSFDEVIHLIWSNPYADEIVRLFHRTLETGEPHVTEEHAEKRLDRGVTEYYEWRIDRITLPDGANGIVCYFRDISAQVLARLAIEESEERLRFMAESMPQKIFTAKPNGEVDYFNQQWMTFTGLEFDEIKAWGWTQFIHPDDVEENVKHWRRSIDTGEPFYFQHRFRRADGVYRWHLSRAHAMRDSQGDVLMWIGSNTEIDDQKRAEEEREKHLAEIEILNARLQRAMTETHHRVKNNLQLMAALIEMQEHNHAEMVPAAEFARLGSNVRALGVIHDILTKEAKEGSEQESLSIKEVLDRLLSTLVLTAGKRGLTFAIEDLRLSGRQATALTLLTNELVSNALKHGSGPTDITFRVSDNEAILQVLDDGPGFPEGFDPTIASNTGIELIQMMVRWDLQGNIAYENRAESGARVRISFPITKR